MFNVLDQHITDDYSLYLGDSCEVLQNFPDESFDLSVYSPPFQSLFSYTPTARDLGNSKTKKDFFEHYRFIVQQLLRITKVGRITAVHVADIAANLTKDGYIGLKDEKQQRINRYYACNDGGILIKKDDKRELSILAGVNVQIANDINPKQPFKDYKVNLGWYQSEIEKIISQIEVSQLVLF